MNPKPRTPRLSRGPCIGPPHRVTFWRPKDVQRSKYGVDMTPKGKADRTVDGIRFHSLKEARRYSELRLRLQLGNIRNLVLQPRYDLYAASGEVIAKYVADFRYEFQGFEVRPPEGFYHPLPWRTIVEDVKGKTTPMYRLKRKWMAAQGVTITEV